MATLVATTIGVMAALALAAGRSRAALIVKSGLVAPVTVPGIVTGTGMLIAFSRVNLEGSFLSLAIAHTVLILPFVVLIVSAGLEAFDRSIEEAARSLGAGRSVRSHGHAATDPGQPGRRRRAGVSHLVR